MHELAQKWCQIAPTDILRHSSKKISKFHSRIENLTVFYKAASISVKEPVSGEISCRKPGPHLIKNECIYLKTMANCSQRPNATFH
jgi:hypothetical protein